MKNTICKMLTFVLLMAAVADGDQITIQRNNTPDIVIPTFNPALGELNSVSLQIQMLGGVTSSSGIHNHGTRSVVSTNIINAVDVFDGFTPLTLSSSPNSNTSHSFGSPNYSGAGLFVGSFNGSTSPSGSHTHPVTITFGAVIPAGQFQWRIQAIETTQNTSPHTHSYPAINKFLNYPNDGSLVPFINGNDIVIPAGNFPTNSTGTHSHSVPSFNRTMQTTSGPQTAFFDSEPTNGTGPHNHNIDPRFTTVATFNFTPPVLLGDVNLDGAINLLDIDPFIDRISTNTFQEEADVNQDGVVNLLDVDPFIVLLSGG